MYNANVLQMLICTSAFRYFVSDVAKIATDGEQPDYQTYVLSLRTLTVNLYSNSSSTSVQGDHAALSI